MDLGSRVEPPRVGFGVWLRQDKPTSEWSDRVARERRHDHQGQSVSFSGTGTDPEGRSLTYAWTFGTGGPPASTNQNPGGITFNTAGVYSVALTVTDAGGASDPTPATRVVTVQSNTPPAGSDPAVVISKAGWRLLFVDSQEFQGENGLARNAFDSDINTIWHTAWFDSSPPPPHELQIDLGATYSVRGFRYLPRQDGGENGRIADYRFYVSSDGVNWGTAVSSGVFPNTRDEAERLFTPKTGRFIRLRALSEVNGNPWTSMAELNVLATGVAGAGPAPASRPRSHGRRRRPVCSMLRRASSSGSMRQTPTESSRE